MPRKVQTDRQSGCGHPTLHFKSALSHPVGSNPPGCEIYAGMASQDAVDVMVHTSSGKPFKLFASYITHLLLASYTYL